MRPIVLVRPLLFFEQTPCTRVANNQLPGILLVRRTMTQNLEPPTFQIPSPYPASGEVIDGKYQVERILGEGGMGAVAKAMHLLRRAPVALKFMSPAVMSMTGAVERFVNEG